VNGRRIEILAPAGSPDALTAAVRSGAAAVYLGVGQFNARQGAHNFRTEELAEVVTYCHAREVAVHLALNTLVRDDELEEALHTARMACESGVDALIVQDVGLARILRVAAPHMPLHASTQLSCHTPEGVRFLRDAGFSRVVLSREMSREEIAACTRLGVETEVFVHGALCMSVSGQCYFSAMLGGRSGNRGLCAQTCRLPFAPTDGLLRQAPPDKAALSLKDNCLIDYVEELIALGVTSLKIEGRMKRPEYVAAACAVYGAAARGQAVDPDALCDLQRVFSRTGFTDGYFTGKRGASMFGVRRKEDVLAASDVLGRLAHAYEREQPLVGVNMHLSATPERCHLTASDRQGHTVTVSGQGTETARQQALSPDKAEQQLRKTGGTPFMVEKIGIHIADGQTLPLSRLNALRRDALEELLKVRGGTAPIPYYHKIPPLPESVSANSTAQVLRFFTYTQWTANDASLVILPLDTPVEHIERVSSFQPVGVEIPRGMFGTESAVRSQLMTARQAGAVAALCGNVGALPLAMEAGLYPIGGFGLNITNRQAVAFYAEKGLKAATLSMELSFDQIKAMKTFSLPVGLLVYGRQPLMLTRNCPRRCAAGHCRDCQHQGLIDRTGTTFPVQCTGGCAEVINSVPLYWGDRMSEVPATAFHLYHFTIESTDEVTSVLNAYKRGDSLPINITRGLYRRGVQ